MSKFKPGDIVRLNAAEVLLTPLTSWLVYKVIVVKEYTKTGCAEIQEGYECWLKNVLEPFDEDYLELVESKSAHEKRIAEGQAAYNAKYKNKEDLPSNSIYRASLKALGYEVKE